MKMMKSPIASLWLPDSDANRDVLVLAVTFLHVAAAFQLMDGVQVTEVDPWTEDGKSLRVLRGQFPAEIATHSTVQDFFFGDDLLLRRHDYNVDVAGGFEAAHLVYDYIKTGGIRLPSKRRAYIRGPDHRPALDSVMVSIDISRVHFTK